MEGQATLATGKQTGTLLLLGALVSLIGLMMFWARSGQKGERAPSFAYYATERGLIVGAMVITALGLIALAELLGLVQSGVRLPARLAALAFAAATSSLIIAEASGLRSEQLPRALVVAFVVPAFLSQAAFGALLGRTHFLPTWIGWTAIAFNLGWLMVLPIITPADIYYPALHHPIPIMIGIALLRRR